MRRGIGSTMVMLLFLTACSGAADSASSVAVESNSGASVQSAAVDPEPDASEPSGTGEVLATTDPVAPPATPAAAATSIPVAVLDPDGERPFVVFVPSGYDETVPTPLVVLLHGFTSNSDLQEAYFKIMPYADERGFLYVSADGTIDDQGRPFWNATEACCNFYGSTVDDSAYLMSLIDNVRAKYSVDPKRIFLIGHSNGGFMSYRMACEHADLIAGIISLAGATFADAADCTPSEPVNVLQIHGSADSVISFEGGSILANSYPSAPATVTTWAAYNGCSGQIAETGGLVDLDAGLAGQESIVSAFSECPAGGAVELWRIEAGGHSPDISDSFVAEAFGFLEAHPKP